MQFDFLELTHALECSFSERVALRPVALCDAWPLFVATRNPMFNQHLLWAQPDREELVLKRVRLIMEASRRGRLTALSAVAATNWRVRRAVSLPTSRHAARYHRNGHLGARQVLAWALQPRTGAPVRVGGVRAVRPGAAAARRVGAREPRLLPPDGGGGHDGQAARCSATPKWAIRPNWSSTRSPAPTGRLGTRPAFRVVRDDRIVLKTPPARATPRVRRARRWQWSSDTAIDRGFVARQCVSPRVRAARRAA